MHTNMGALCAEMKRYWPLHIVCLRGLTLEGDIVAWNDLQGSEDLGPNQIKNTRSTHDGNTAARRKKKSGEVVESSSGKVISYTHKHTQTHT